MRGVLGPRPGPATSYLTGLREAGRLKRARRQTLVLRQRGWHHSGTATAPVSKALGFWVSTCLCPHIETFSSHPGRSRRSPTLAGQGCWEETRLGSALVHLHWVRLFLCGCHGNRNNSCCRKPLHTTTLLLNQWQHLCLFPFPPSGNSELSRSLAEQAAL